MEKEINGETDISLIFYFFLKNNPFITASLDAKKENKDEENSDQSLFLRLFVFLIKIVEVLYLFIYVFVKLK